MGVGIKSCGVPGDIIATEEVTAYNRTGSALVAGGLYCLDLDASSTEASAYATWRETDTTPTPAENPLANVVAVATADLDGGIFVVANEATADNDIGRFTVRGIVKIEVKKGDGTAAELSAAGPFTGVDAANHIVALTDGSVSLGLGLETSATATTSTTEQVWTIFDGVALHQSEV